MRSSTVLRVSRLSRLLAVLSVRELPQVEIASLLRCSTSSARNYVLELLEAGVIETVPHGHANGRMYKSLYRLGPDQGLISAFRASLEQGGEWERPERPVRQCALERKPERSVIRVESSQWMLPSGGAAVRRDPLVSALFGD
ncbi:hypothetical protein [Massilia niastensis]|uniref:hypothetical protein n=1 Tax=Massilia niastensis TaxID=544911 RepID=UPI00036882BA|nr:hypothetical protein [Massilia niastensis]